jgi:EpsI family protein
LSIAYGENQSRDLQIHRPEVCYSAQGFRIASVQKAFVQTSTVAIPALRLVATLGNRNEPITYWVRIGETLVRGNLEQGIARLSYGLSGYVPDGVLFRVSSITQTNSEGYEIQQAFINELLTAVPSNTKAYLLGNGHL